MKPLQILIAACLLVLTLADHDIKTRHAYSAGASSSNAFAGSFAGGNSFAGAGNIPNPAAFWWAGPESPFKDAYEYFRRCSLKGDCANIPGPFPGIAANIPNNLPDNGCNSNGCSFSGGFNVNDKVQTGKDSNYGPIDISKNPFLNGEFKNVAVSSCSGSGCPGGKPQTTITTTQCKGTDCKTNTQHGAPLDISKNPFLGGGFAGAGGFAAAGAGTFGGSGCSGVKGGCSGQIPTTGCGSSGGCSTGQTTFQSSFGSTGFTSGSGCSGVKGGCGGSFGNTQTSTTNGFGGQTSFSGSNTYPGKDAQPIPSNYPSQSGYNGGSQSHSTAGSFAGSTSGFQATGQFGSTSQSGQTTGQFGSTSQPGQTLSGNYPSGSATKPGYQQPQQAEKCSGQGLTCVKKHLCNNGFVNVNGDGLFQVRHGEQYCDVNTEVCCQLPGSSGQPHKDINIQLPSQPGSQSIYTTSSHQSSAASAAASASSSQAASSSTFFNSNTPSLDVTARFPTPAPRPAFNPAPGVYQPNQPSKSGYKPNQPENQQYQPNAPSFQPGNQNYQPGQSFNFEGKDGTSPGVIQVVPDGQEPSDRQSPDLLRPQKPGSPGLTHITPNNQGSTPGLTHITPGNQGSTPGLTHITPGNQGSTPGLTHIYPNNAPTIQPNSVQVSPAGNDYTEVHNELNFASTLQGPAYLPPGPSPSPSPSNYSPDLLPPNIPQQPPRQTTPKPVYPQPSNPPTQSYYPTTPPPVNRFPQPSSPAPNNIYPTSRFPQPSSPAPTNYYPTTRFPQPSTPPPTKYSPQPSTSGYLPPFSGAPSGQPPKVIPTTKKPTVTNGYLPPTNEIPSASSGDNAYLPPPSDKVPDSNIININILRPTSPPLKTSKTTIDFNTTPYPGCAAALKCVTEDFCTAEGVISPVQVVLTKEQQVNRVPLTECQDPESGIIGKCCRDPDYKDPWPSTQLGLFNPDQDGAGSNNGQYVQRGNNGQYRPNTTPGVKGRPPGPGPRPVNPYEPNQVGAPSNNPNAYARPGGYPTNTPNIPFDSRLVNKPLQVDTKPPFETDYSQKVPTTTKITGENCGVRRPDSKPAGPGPIDANFAEIPWQAMILRDTNRSLLCGGAIIRRDVVLTAAHCVENLQANDVLVKGGEWKLGIDEEPKPFQINKVATIVRHPGYNPQTKLNDVALLILNEKFRIDKNVDTLCLPDPNEDVAKKFQKAKCITTGWGKTILQLNIVNSLMHILGVGILPASQCQQQLQQYHSDSAYLYNANCVCGAPVQEQADICDVDVGSALACDRGDGHYTLAGIYSWDTGCNPTAQIAGYTKVDTQWIESTLQRPIKDLRTEERGFYTQLAQATGQECHCLPGK